jgi:type II secretory pathway pseudopilin PulG
MTLVEVVAAMTLLATVAAMALTAQARLQRQWRSADLQQQAVAIADRMIEQWWAQSGGVPARQSGSIVDRPGWSYRTAARGDMRLGVHGLQVMRVQLFAPDAPMDQDPTLEIELLAPVARPVPVVPARNAVP